MFSALEFSISIDDELSALLADYAAFTDGEAGLPVDVTTADATDLVAVVDPMTAADAMVFTGSTAPADAGAPGDPAAGPAPDPAPADVPADLAADATLDLAGLPSLDGLVQLDGDGFDLDLSILDVGRGFGQFGFNDLP